VKQFTLREIYREYLPGLIQGFVDRLAYLTSAPFLHLIAFFRPRRRGSRAVPGGEHHRP
jgi:hypothetical protein